MSTRRRREFLTQIAAASSLAVLTPSTSCARSCQGGGERRGQGRGPPQRSRVVRVRSPGVVTRGHKLDRARLRRMLEMGLCRLTGTKDARAALSRWIRPVDTVGLKVNCMAGRQMSTHVELVEELVGLLASMGLPRKQALVFDRSDRDLERAGFEVGRAAQSSYRCMGNDRAGYEDEVAVMPNGASRFSRVATSYASVLINLPVLKDHGLAGLSGALKNNFGLIHNPNKFHLNGCDPHVAEVNARPEVRAKQRLVICDALRVQVEGGPAYHPAGARSYEGILLATDPVALDLLAWDVLEALRKEQNLPSLAQDKRSPVHVATAAKQGLGVGKRSHIDLVEVKL